jgi:hypothetical protein
MNFKEEKKRLVGNGEREREKTGNALDHDGLSVRSTRTINMTGFTALRVQREAELC